MQTITYVGGCGRLGLSLAAWSAHRGYRVFCADVNEAAVAIVNGGHSPHYEPEVNDLVRQHHGTRLVATSDTAEAVRHSDLVVVLVPTPSQDDGAFSLAYVLRACEDIGAGLQDRADYVTVIIGSTVNPGDTGGPIRAALERASGGLAGHDWGLNYSPEFVRQGSIVQDFAHPSQVLIGEYDAPSGDAAAAYYRDMVENEAPVYRMSLVSAEIAKIGLNTTIVTKMAVANQLAWICHFYPGADARDVLAAIGADPRIGAKYFGAGAPDGGPCFPRDSRALVAAARQARHAPAPIARAVDTWRADQIGLIAKLVERHTPRGSVVGILGLTYKPGTDITTESPGLKVAQRLARTVAFFDPSGVQSKDHANAATLDELVAGCDTLLIATPWPDFQALTELDLTGKVVVDLWGLFEDEQLSGRYVRLGRGE